MMRREEFLLGHPNIKSDMAAYTEDGEKIGTVTSLNEASIDIGKGEFFPRDFAVRYDDISDVEDGRLVISKSFDDLSAWMDESYEGWDKIRELDKGTEFDMTLLEEELVPKREKHQTGQVRLRKVVHTEERTFTIPVMREEVIVERLGGGDSLTAGGQAFTEEELTIPIMEEEIEIIKRTKVKDRIHAKKETHIENQEVSGAARAEDVEVIRETIGSTSKKEGAREQREALEEVEEEEEYEG